MTDGLVAELDRRCLAGLAAAAAALAGGDPRTVCRRFAEWKRTERRRAWPWVPGLCWEALEPLGVGFPAGDDAAVTLGRLLVGAETGAERVSGALSAVAARAGAPGRERGVGSSSDHQALLIAVERFWRDLARVAGRLHDAVQAGDRAEADALLLAGRRRLEEQAERIAGYARRVAERRTAPERPAAPSPVATIAPTVAPATPAATAPQRPALAPQPPAPAAPAAHAPDGPRGSATTTWALGESAEHGRDHLEDDDHHLAPVVFLAGVTLVALIWLLVIATQGG